MSIQKSEPTQQNFAEETFEAEGGEDAEAVRPPEVKAAGGPAKAAQAAPRANGDTRKA